MTSDRRTRLDPSERRAQLVELGVHELAEHGLHDLSVETVAARAGISKALLFHYFGSKRRYRLAVVAAVADDLLARTEPDPEQPPDVQLRQSIVDSVEYVSARRQLYLSLVRGAASGDAEMREIVDRTRSALVARILDGATDLGLPSDDPLLPVAVRSWLALAEEAIIAWAPDGPVSLDRLLDFVESSFYRTVAGRP